jgi:hypothetical protein
VGGAESDVRATLTLSRGIARLPRSAHDKVAECASAAATPTPPRSLSPGRPAVPAGRLGPVTVDTATDIGMPGNSSSRASRQPADIPLCLPPRFRGPAGAKIREPLPQFGCRSRSTQPPGPLDSPTPYEPALAAHFVRGVGILRFSWSAFRSEPAASKYAACKAAPP